LRGLLPPYFASLDVESPTNFKNICQGIGMSFLKTILGLILIIFIAAARAEGGGFYKEGKKFSPIRTIGAVGGAALAV